MIRFNESLGGPPRSKPTDPYPGNSQGEAGVADGFVWAFNSGLALFLALLHVPHLANPLGVNRLDDSWRVDNYLAVLHHLGTRYIWPYGPLGFVTHPIEISRALLAVSDIVQVGVATLLAVLFVRILRNQLRVPAATGTLIIGAMLLPGMSFWFFLDFAVVICALMCLFLATPHTSSGKSLSENRLRAYRYVVAAGFLLTVAALMKVSWLPMLAGITAIWGAWTIRRRMLAGLACFLLSSITTWLVVFAAAGGGVGSGLRWPVTELPIVFGYSEAMSFGGSVGYVILAFAIASLTAVCGAMVLLGESEAWWWVASIVLLWLIGFKEGFVRQDGHVFLFIAAVQWCAFLLWSALGRTETLHDGRGPQKSMRLSRVGTASTVGAVAVCFFALVGWSATVPNATELRDRLSDLVEAVRFVRSETYAQARMAELRQMALQQRPDLEPLVPLLEGRRAFAWPWDGNAVVAAGAIQTFPPVPQEYSAYTSSLDSADARFFSSSNRPQLGLISVEAIDGRLPLQTAGLSFVRLLSGYRPVALSGNYLLVASTGSDPSPGSDLSPPTTPWQSARLGEWVAVPAVPRHVTIAQIRIHPTRLGTLLTLALRNTRPLYMRFRMADGATRFFRVVRQTLPDGVVVSTTFSNVGELADLWLGNGRNDVRAIALETGPPLEWTSTFMLRFLEMPLARSPGGAVTLVPGTATSDLAKTIPLRVHIDSFQPMGGEEKGELLRIEGWYAPNAGSSMVEETLGAVTRPGEAVVLDHYTVARPDVVKALGPGTPLLSGFVTFVPRTLWGKSHQIAVLRLHNGTYRLLGSIEALAAPPALQSLFVDDNAAERAWTVLSTIYRGREDLQRAFPEGAKDFVRRLLSWAVVSGVTVDGDRDVLLPYKPELEVLSRLAPSEKFGAMPAPPALRSLFVDDKAAERAWTVLSTIYRGREDLQRAFPEGAKDFVQRLLSWAVLSGVTVDGDKNVLILYKPKLEVMYRLVAFGKRAQHRTWNLQTARPVLMHDIARGKM